MTGRELLTAERIYFVRSDGSDANDGLTDSPAGSFKTWARATQATALLDFGGQPVTIQHGNEAAPVVFAENIFIPSMTGGGSLHLKGSPTPGKTTIQAASPGDTTLWLYDTHIHVFLWQMGLEGGSVLADVSYNSTLALRDGVVFGAASFAHLFVHDAQSLLMDVTGHTTITGSAPYHVLVNGGMAFVESNFIDLQNSPTFTAFFGAMNGAKIQCVRTTFTGAAHGLRFWAITNSVIQTFDAGPTYLPGDQPGTTDSGGQYV